MNKTLVAFFSASGVTKHTAKTIAENIGADLYEIRPEIPYTAADLNWQDRNSRSSLEMKDKSSRPVIADKDANIQAYDTIFLGFPIWWYVAPVIINTFLESYDFSGKNVILFATSGGSGFGKTVKSLEHSVAPSAMLREGRVFSGSADESEIKQWPEKLFGEEEEI